MNWKRLAPLAVLAVCAGSQAQVTKPLNISLRVGVFMPSYGGARDEGSSWFAIGAESRIKNIGVSTTHPGQSSYLTISVDSYSQSGFRNLPILLNYVYRQNELFFTGGAGFAMVEEPNRANDGTRLGFQFGAGWDFQKGSTPLFIEVKWFGTSKNDHLSGFGAYLGVRL
jgi:hypothetical protein